MSTRKPKVKSSSRRRKANAKLGYGETSKNVGTLRKIEKANSDEKEIETEIENPVILPFEPLSQESLDIGNSTHLPGRETYEYGEVGTVYDESQNPKGKEHWYLLYVARNSHTGGFSTKERATLWYTRGGR